MRHIVQIAPLAALPAHASFFDYAWEGDVVPSIGMIVEIPFRSGKSYGLVISISTFSKFKLKTISPTQAYHLLSPTEVTWLSYFAKRTKLNIGLLAMHALPPLSKRTIGTLTRAFSKKEQKRAGKLQYLWYTQQNSIEKALEQLTSDGSKPAMIVAASQLDAERWTLALQAKMPSRIVHHFVAESAPKRRAIWLDWVLSGDAPVIVGTQLPTWLPSRADANIILVEPTHSAHIQREGLTYSTRDVVEYRRNHFGEHVFIIAHSPATPDLDRITSLPALAHWPVMLDRTTEDPKLRQSFISPSLEHALHSASRVLILVTHLREATHYICKDCGTLFRSAELSDSALCKKCGGARFSKIGFGAQTAIDELKAAEIITADEEFVMLDAEKFKTHTTDERDPKITIATAPLFDRLPLNSFDIILDLSTDFELLHPQYTTEECLWQRLRAMSVRLSSAWSGAWLTQTRVPNLLGWRARDFEGYLSWWLSEKNLRQRFKQPPFSED